MDESFLDHLFNAIGHLNRANKRSQAEKSRGDGEGRRIKRMAFDEAPAPAPAPEAPASGDGKRKRGSCCAAKR